jgi:ATP-dependent helicase YprA (DUF1998 family)
MLDIGSAAQLLACLLVSLCEFDTEIRQQSGRFGRKKAGMP